MLIGAVLAAGLIGAVMLLVLGANPLTGYAALIDGAFGGTKNLANSALKAMPLLLVGAGITVAFRTGVINIGGEGQIIAGAILSTLLVLALPDVPRLILLPSAFLFGAIGGAIWGGMAGALKSYAGVNEILSTIMLNIIAVQILNLLLRGPLMDPGEIERGSRIPHTERLSGNADLPILPGGTRLHFGVIVAVVMAVVCYVLLFRTTQGLRLRASGHNPFASLYAGMSVKRNVVLAFMYSGAMCGLAGVTLVFGSEGHRLATDGGATTFTGAAGFNGIVAALFGGLHPLWTIPASFLFGALLVGANAMQREVQVPAALILGLNGLVVVFVVASLQTRVKLAQIASRLRGEEQADLSLSEETRSSEVGADTS
ncbi:MAG: ABC transporter permease [bacterium]|nr:ABC transporter permease [bacterium]